MAPLDWFVGCRLLGNVADHFERRRPVLIGGAGEVKGSSTRAAIFLVFTPSALMAPICSWALTALSYGLPLSLPVFQKAGMIGASGIVLAIVLSFFIKKTGWSTVRPATNDTAQKVQISGASP